MVGVGAAGFVPIAFVDGDHFAGVAGDAAVGEEVGRVGEDEVDGIWGKGGEDFQAIALVEAEVVGGVVEDGGWPFAALRVKERCGHKLKTKSRSLAALGMTTTLDAGPLLGSGLQRTAKISCATGSLIRPGSLIKG